MLAAYLSSSESEAPPPASSKSDKKRTSKRKRPPPQEAINKLWRDFVVKKPSKALSILPFASVPKPTGLERDNELLSAGFDRAAAECRSKVEKIIRECKRVNTRYRDPGFDLDWDLRTGTGNCLNSLGSTKFDVSSYRWWSIGKSVPKAVKRVHEIFEKPTFMSNINSSDIKQGALGDCWFISGLSGLANAPELLKRLCVAYDTRIGIYGFVFYRDGEWVYSIIDDKLYLVSADWDHPSLGRHLLQNIDREDNEQVYRKTYQNGSKALFFAKCKDDDETWVPLMEKAYAKCHGDFASLAGGFSGEGLEDLTGGVTTEVFTSDILDLDGFWENELMKVNEEFLFSCTTGLMEPGYGQREGIEEAHAYMLLAARTLTKGEKAGTRLVLLRNPWGATRKGVWEGAFSDGSKEWTPEIQAELGHHFGQDSVFWITYEDLIRKFTQFDRTRLFRDADWRCCQRFAGCEVPWKPQFEEKFTFKLTKNSPLVLVLSQLDNRYFKGLQGQYYFKLHFRLHEKDRPEPADYIVRSHGNYLMSRSVAVELPDMEPAEYSVFISVTATRRLKNPTVEEVVKRETKNRSQNDKLAQVGLAYDLAHAKAARHIEAMAKKRQRITWQRSSEKRKAYRLHEWDQKHRAAKIEKKKAKKDKEKKEKLVAERKARRARREAEAKAKWEAEEAERKKKEEEEAVKKKKKEEAEAEEKKRKDEAEEMERKKIEAEEEATKPKDKSTQTDTPEPKTEEKRVQADSKELFLDESDAETPQGTPQSTPSCEKSNLCSREGSVMGDDNKQKGEEAGKASTDDSSQVTSENGAEKSGQGGEPSKLEVEQRTKDQSTQTETVDEKSTDEKPEDGKSEDKKPNDEKPKGDESKDEKSKDDKLQDEKSRDGKPKDDKEDSSEKANESRDQDSAKTDKDKKSDQPKESRPPKVIHSDTEAESSASPLSDWEELYSSDDMSRKPRREATKYAALAVTASSTCDKKHVGEEEESNLPEPWNAICIVGFKVYSKDENLTLRIVDVEDETVESNGEIGGAGKLGEKVSNDLDSGVLNAAGGLSKVEETKSEDSEEKKVEDGEKADDEKKDGEKKDDEKKDDEKKDDEKKERNAASDVKEDGEKKQEEGKTGDAVEPEDKNDEKTHQQDDKSEEEKPNTDKNKTKDKQGDEQEKQKDSKDSNQSESRARKSAYIIYEDEEDTSDETYVTGDEKYFTSDEVLL